MKPLTETTGSRNHTLFSVAVLLALLGCSRPQLPKIPVAGVDPVITTQISNTIAEVKSAPRSAAAWGKLGMVLEAAGFEAQATTCFVHAEKLDPKDPRWPYFQNTIESLQRAASRTSADFVRVQLARLLMEAGRWSEAEPHFRAVGHSLGLAQVACAQAKWQEALPHLQQARQNKYMAQAATAFLANVNLRLGRTNEARALSAEAAEMPPDAKWPNAFETELSRYRIGKREWMERAQEALQERDLPTAAPHIERLVTSYPDFPEGWLYLGRACIIQSNLVTAEQALARHLQLDPASVDGHLQLGLVRYRQNRLADAAAEFQTALRSKPDSENAHYFLGQIRRRMGDNEGARQSFREALRANPAFEPARIALDELAAKR